MPPTDEPNEHQSEEYAATSDRHVVVTSETTTLRDGVRGQEFTLSHEVEAALHVDRI
jgi:hypothetical protein